MFLFVFRAWFKYLRAFLSMRACVFKNVRARHRLGKTTFPRLEVRPDNVRGDGTTKHGLHQTEQTNAQRVAKNAQLSCVCFFSMFASCVMYVRSF